MVPPNFPMQRTGGQREPAAADRETSDGQRNEAGVRIAILASHEGTTLQAVVDACAAGILSCQVA